MKYHGSRDSDIEQEHGQTWRFCLEPSIMKYVKGAFVISICRMAQISSNAKGKIFLKQG